MIKVIVKFINIFPIFGGGGGRGGATAATRALVLVVVVVLRSFRILMTCIADFSEDPLKFKFLYMLHATCHMTHIINHSF